MPAPLSMTPQELVGTLATVAPDDRCEDDRAAAARLVERGADVWGMVGRLDRLSELAIGYRRNVFPVELTMPPRSSPELESLLEKLREDHLAMREAARSGWDVHDRSFERSILEAPSGYPHTDLRSADPARVFVVDLSEDVDTFFSQVDDGGLARCSGVEVLHLAHLRLHTHDFERNVDFARMTRLRHLSLADNRITELPAGIEHCARLRGLDLGRNILWRPDPPSRMEQLAECSELRWLRVGVGECPWPPEDRDRLRALLPQCVVEFD